MRNILTSETSTQQLKRATEAGTEPEVLKSLSNFQDYLVLQGMTKYADLNLSLSNIQNHYHNLFQKYHPRKVPSDLDYAGSHSLRFGSR